MAESSGDPYFVATVTAGGHGPPARHVEAPPAERRRRRKRRRRKKSSLFFGRRRRKKSKLPQAMGRKRSDFLGKNFFGNAVDSFFRFFFVLFVLSF